MAVDLEMDPSDVPRVFSRPDDIIIRDGKAWLPIETTDRTGDFVTAWRTAAREWREASAKKVSGFMSVHDAWREYQPVAYTGAAKIAPQPDARATASAFRSSLAAFVSGELGPRIASLQAELKGKGGTPALYNRLGVLYARFGQTDKAEEQFLAAIAAGKDNQSALFNMGNILYVRGKYTDAITYYSRVLKASPSHPQALLSLSRSSAALGKYTDALAYYERLRKADSALAAQNAWLANPQGDGTRAAEAGGKKGEVTWQD
jgi:tetratricopeptide (TPR) repeat protein